MHQPRSAEAKNVPATWRELHRPETGRRQSTRMGARRGAMRCVLARPRHRPAPQGQMLVRTRALRPDERGTLAPGVAARPDPVPFQPYQSLKSSGWRDQPTPPGADVYRRSPSPSATSRTSPSGRPREQPTRSGWNRTHRRSRFRPVRAPSSVDPGRNQDRRHAQIRLGDGLHPFVDPVAAGLITLRDFCGFVLEALLLSLT